LIIGISLEECPSAQIEENNHLWETPIEAQVPVINVNSFRNILYTQYTVYSIYCMLNILYTQYTVYSIYCMLNILYTQYTVYSI